MQNPGKWVESVPMYWFPEAALYSIANWVGSNNRNLLSSSSGEQKSETEVSAGPYSF